MIKQLLAGKKLKPLQAEFIEQLNLLNNAVRGTQRDCEMNLKCQYIQAFKGKNFSGEISMINHRVIGVYLSEFDIHGQIEVRSLNEEYSFKQESLQLSTPTLNLKIKQRVNVCIDAIDQNQRSVKLRLLRDENDTADTSKPNEAAVNEPSK
jgi:exoribonuclease R